jgi:presenilin-like A22 family membrane protease
MSKKSSVKKTKKKNVQKNDVKNITENNLIKKINWEALFVLLIVFIIVETLGLLVAYSLSAQGVEPELFSDDGESLWNTIYLFISIMVMTGVILLIMKLRKKKQTLIFFESIAVFTTSLIVFETFFGEPTGLFMAICILLWRLVFRKSIIFRNFVGIIAIAGAGAIIGMSLSLIPIIAFIIMLAIYDLIAVFKTKHMVTIGKEVTNGNYAFTIALPTSDKKFELGNGDLVIPLVVASSVLTKGPFENNLLVVALLMIASYIGLAISIQSVSILKKPLPALPPQTALMLLVIIISFILGF